MCDDLYRRWGLRRLLNASGNLTINTASPVPPALRQVADWALARSFVLAELHERAGPVIARATGAESGCITACSAAGITLAVAACMAGADEARVRQLPDTGGMKNEIVLMTGHFVSYGQEVTQAVRLAGGTVVAAGTPARSLRPVSGASCNASHLESVITEQTAAGLFVASWHSQQDGLLDLPTFAAICHGRGVPVVVDAAAEADLHRFHRDGADLVIQSGHKFLAAPTSGVVSGRADLIRAVLAHQAAGIGRAMKVGKEGILGALAALERWQTQDTAAVRQTLLDRLAIAEQAFAGRPGVTTRVGADPTGNPWPDLEVHFDQAATGVDARALAAALYAGDPAVAVRAMPTAGNYLFIDPRALNDDEMAEMCAIILRRVETMGASDTAAGRAVAG
ncbi:MAG: aminotransferase class V-fold PLP-dependent enzyme [Alphaproteobacteria bacterium]